MGVCWTKHLLLNVHVVYLYFSSSQPQLINTSSDVV